MKKIVFALVAILVVAVAGYIAFSKTKNTEVLLSDVPAASQSTEPAATPPTQVVPEPPAPVQVAPTPTPVAPAPTAQPGIYTMAEVTTHNSAASCWSAINGGVYDLTAWVSQHPGGKQAILGICGKDGSSAFDQKHGGQRRPANELAGYKIGTLAK